MMNRIRTDVLFPSRFIFWTATVLIGGGLVLSSPFEFSSCQAGDADESASALDSAGAKSISTIESLHADVRKRLVDLERQVSEKNDQVPRFVEDELDILSWLDLTYSRHLSIEAQRATVQKKVEDAADQLAALRKFGLREEAPYSFLVLDEVRDEQLIVRSRKAALESQIATSEGLIETAKIGLSTAESKRRLLQESWADADDQEKQELQLELERAQLVSQANHASLNQLEAEATLSESQLKAVSSQLEFLEEKDRIIRTDVEFLVEDLNVKLAELDKAEKRLRADITSAQRELTRLQWKQLKSISSGAAEPEDARVQQFRDDRNEEVGAMHQLLRELVIVRAAWRKRFEIANGLTSHVELQESRTVLQGALNRVSNLEETVSAQMDQRRDELMAAKQVLSELDEAELENSKHAKLPELQRSLIALNSYVSITRAGKRLFRRAIEDIDAAIAPETSSWSFSSLNYAVSSLWNYEITSVDDRSITVGKILNGVGLLICSLLMARWLSRLLGRRILPSFGVNQAGAAAIQSIAFYGMLFSFGFVVLEWVNVPLTGLAFLSGAIAIGVGFGSQNILNNFISGMIILAERPIRKGDLVDIDGLSATIEHIGARSTRVKTGANLEIIVPNSTFLENNVTNWTLSDTRIRVEIKVGVAYGTSPTRVIELLSEAAIEHEEVLKNPEPIILFKDFGDDALLFECHFWIHMKTMMASERIRSSIRCRIDELFSEAGITIAYPQRDVHLDTLQPLQVSIQQVAEEVSKPVIRKSA